MGVDLILPRKKRHKTIKEKLRESKGTRWCIPHEDDDQFNAIMHYFDKLVNTPKLLPVMVRRGTDEVFSRLKHGKPPKFFKLLRRSPKAKPSIYPSKTATLKRLLIFTTEDDGEDTREFLEWYISTNKLLKTVYRAGEPAIRIYTYTRKGIGANYVKPRPLRLEQSPKVNAKELEVRSCAVQDASYLTRLESDCEEWTTARKGLEPKERTQVLRDRPDLRRHDVRVREEIRGYFVGGEEKEYTDLDEAEARAEELVARPPTAADAPSRIEQALGGAKEAAKEAVQGKADAEAGQESSLFWAKKNTKATAKRKKRARKDANTAERGATKKKGTLQKLKGKLAAAEVELAADPTDKEKKTLAGRLRRAIFKQEQHVNDAEVDVAKARTNVKVAETLDDEHNQTKQAVQDLSPEEWAARDAEEERKRSLAAVAAVEESGWESAAASVLATPLYA